MSEVAQHAPPRPRRLRTRRGIEVHLPLFLPVYSRSASLVPIAGWEETFGVEGCIVNAYLLYKDRELRRRFRDTDLTLSELLGFDGLLMTDSGAYQGFSGRLLLENKKIVAFQDSLGADVISPLDLVTPPGDNRTQATWKLRRTLERVREAREIATRSLVASVQQGGRFLDLRRQSLDALMEMGVDYLALGSLVPFFNRGHDLELVGRVIAEARHLVSNAVPIHVYGAGDPVELPFLFALGAEVFDSASYGHYAQGGWYMTPYGALDRGRLVARESELPCPCGACASAGRPSALLDDPRALAGHNLWTILETVRELRTLGRGPALTRRLEAILDRHREWFPDSRLATSWRRLHA